MEKSNQLVIGTIFYLSFFNDLMRNKPVNSL